MTADYNNLTACTEANFRIALALGKHGPWASYCRTVLLNCAEYVSERKDFEHHAAPMLAEIDRLNKRGECAAAERLYAAFALLSLAVCAFLDLDTIREALNG
jgi:hypothetical protein